MPNYRIALLTNDPQWKGHAARIKRAAEAALKSEKAPSLSLTIALDNDKAVKSLNAQFRGKNKPTNVLSFPDGAGGHLGDIILAYETIAREAKEQGKKLPDHVTHLTVHGVLHLLGYDHENAKDAKTMEHKEVMLLSRMGIANPYE